MQIPDAPNSTSKPKRRYLCAWTIGTFFGAGHMRPGPGTWGSVLAALMWLAAVRLLSLHGVVLFAVTALAAAFFFAIGVPASTRLARITRKEDPNFVVVDEAVGQWIVLLGCPIAPLSHHPFNWWIAAICLFRFFDIVKPWPIRRLESLREGWGIMVDDVGAGVFGLILMLLARKLMLP
jgi:phosphatidylglycerophosphatase A